MLLLRRVVPRLDAAEIVLSPTLVSEPETEFEDEVVCP